MSRDRISQIHLATEYTFPGENAVLEHTWREGRRQFRVCFRPSWGMWGRVGRWEPSTQTGVRLQLQTVGCWASAREIRTWKGRPGIKSMPSKRRECAQKISQAIWCFQSDQTSCNTWAALGAQTVKNLLAMQETEETWVWLLGGKEKGMTTPWRREWGPTPVFLPGEVHGLEFWRAAVHGVTKSWTWLSN